MLATEQAKCAASEEKIETLTQDMEKAVVAEQEKVVAAQRQMEEMQAAQAGESAAVIQGLQEELATAQGQADSQLAQLKETLADEQTALATEKSKAAALQAEVESHRAGLTDTEKIQGIKAFLCMDVDNSGNLDMAELSKALSGILKGKALKKMLEVLDTDGNSVVSIDEWLSYLAQKKQDKGPAYFEKFLSLIHISEPTRPY